MPVTFEGFAVNVDKYKAAFNAAKTIVTKAQLSAGSISTNKSKTGDAFAQARTAFRRFWGGNDSDAVAELLRILKNAFYSDLKIIFNNDPDSKAFVYESDQAKAPGSPYTAEMCFCPPLIEGFAAMGTNSAAGTIVHEMSHLVLATDDHKYGMKSCTEIADNKKIANADNFKYYCELFQLVSLKNLPVLSDAYDLKNAPPKHR
jgi:hypothetical protein